MKNLQRTPHFLGGVLIIVLIANVVVGIGWRSRAISARADVEPPTLRVAVWEDYIAPALVERFNRAQSCRVEITTFSTNEELLERVMREDERFDLIVPSSYVIPKLVSLRAIEELNRTRLSNRGMIDASIDTLAFPKKSPTGRTDAFAQYGVPFVIAQTGIAASTKAGIPEEQLRSWRVFERSDLKGRATLLHDMRETFAAALLALGHNVNAVDGQSLADATKLIFKWLAVAQFNDDSYAAELPAGRVIVAHAYPGDVGHILGGERGIEFFVPREGGSVSIEYMCIMRNSPNTKLAYAFIDHLLEIQNASDNMEWSHIRTASSATYEHFVARLEGKPNPIPSVLKSIPDELVLRPLSEEDYEKYELLWRTLAPVDAPTRGGAND